MVQSSLFEIRSRMVVGHAGQHLFPCICGEVKLTSPMTSISDITDHSLVLMYLLLHISGWLVTFAAWIFSIASSRITSFMDSVSSATRQCVLYNFGLFIAYYRVLVFRLANNFDFEVHRLKYFGCKAIFPWVDTVWMWLIMVKVNRCRTYFSCFGNWALVSAWVKPYWSACFGFHDFV